MSDSPTPDRLLALLFALGSEIRRQVLATRDGAACPQDLAGVAAVTAADVIYRIDRVSESAILAWFSEYWPAQWPVEVVMEGLEDDAPVTFPRGTSVGATQWKCILDPIDGTRPLMYDKRSAWSLAAIAPQRGAATTLADIEVAAMAELPTTRAARADDIGAVRGRGAAGVIARTHDLRSGETRPFRVQPSAATDFAHGFASFVRFFPAGKALTARLEEDLWERLRADRPQAELVVFDDQYLSTGGQLHELLTGRDRMLGDLRPLVLPKVGQPHALACHPYDICTALVLIEAGGVVEDPRGGPLAAPLDTTTPVAWIAYANRELAAWVRPHLRAVLEQHGLI